MSDLPYFLRHGEVWRERELLRDWQRRCYENRSSDDRLPRHWQTLDDVLDEANLLAQQVLPEGAES